ncbi:MAG: IS630 family transposase [Bacteroidota bacterium]
MSYINQVDLFFTDESGFNMSAYVPYGWQPKGEYIEITPTKTPSLQIFGLVSLDNRFDGYSCKGSVNSATVIAFLDDFQTRIKQPTVVVLDNAPVHHSTEFEAKIEVWKQKDLYIFFLPKYSPHLNPIEILWRKLKYEWIHYEDLENQQQLEKPVYEILNQFGNRYTIIFKEQKCWIFLYSYLHLKILVELDVFMI